MILKGEGLTTKPFAHCVSFGLFYFIPLLTSKLDHVKNKKALNSSSSGFVVAGTGLFYDPERGGLNNEALRSLRERWSFLFYSIAYKQA